MRRGRLRELQDGTLIDDGAAARDLIAKNIALCRTSARHLRHDATRLPQNPGATYDLIFLDPPYDKGLGEAALQSARAANWLAPEALVVWEEGTALAPPQGFARLDQRRYGETYVTILRAP